MNVSTLVFPLPFGLHVAFVLISVALLIFCYIFKKQRYHLYLIIGIISTMLVYVAHPKIIFYLLGIEEFVLLGLAAFDMHKAEKAARIAEEKKKAAESAADNE